MALVRLSFDKNKQFRGQTFEDIPLLKDSFSEDAEIAGRAASLRAETRQKMNARVAELPTQINTALAQESALGNLLTQCLYKWSRLDGAVLNSDSIRSSLPAGRLSEYDLYKAYPYNFPQIAGFTVSYADTPQGKKIRQITLDNGRAVRPQDTYRFAVTDHVLAGGFGHDGFIDSLEFKNTFVEARQIMRSCLARQKTVEAPALGRWKKVK